MVSYALNTLLTVIQLWVGSKAVEPIFEDGNNVIKNEKEEIFKKASKLCKPKEKKLLTLAMELRVLNRRGVEIIGEDDGLSEAAEEEEEADLSEYFPLIEKMFKERIHIDADTTEDWFSAID